MDERQEERTGRAAAGTVADEAARLIEAHEGQRPASLDVFLDYVGLTEAEFMEIAMSHQVSPNAHDPAAVRRGAPLWDQPLWDRIR